MLFLVPHLFAAARLLDAAAGDLSLPALQTLLARGSRQPCPADGVEAALCQALGIARQRDWPLAPITLQADGGIPGEAYWLRADPVHLKVMRDRIVLADRESVGLSRGESDRLAEAIGRHFGPAFSPLPLHPQRWYLRFPEAPDLTTTPFSLAVGCDIEPLLPQGRDARRFRGHLNELQMLLHANPVNQEREARGDLPVNSLWPWGGGCRPASPASRLAVHGGDAAAQALAAFCGAPANPLPARLEPHLLEMDGIVVLDALTRAGQVGDPYGWREGLRELERDWFVPLLAMLRRIGQQGAQLADPVGGKALHLHAHDAWRLWRRPRPLAAMLA